MVHSSKFMAKQLLLCALSALLLIFSFPDANLWIFAWFAFVPLFFAIQGASRAKAFFLSYLCGVIFWWGTIYWLIHVTFIGTFVLVLYLSLYFGIFGFFVFTMNHEPRTMNAFLLPSIWVLLEYVRSYLFSGFPWALLGYSQYLNLPSIQIADVAGAWGVSFLVMMANAVIYSLIAYRLSLTGLTRLSVVGLIKRYFLIGFIFIAVFSYGYYKINRAAGSGHRAAMRASVIQGNIPQELKWNAKSEQFIIDKYLALSLASLKDHPDLIIWPEASLPTVLEEGSSYYERVSEFAKEKKTPMLIGAVRNERELYYNSALLISKEGALVRTYDKLHLVPFGEYIPLKNILPFLQTIVPIGDITPGKEYAVFSQGSTTGTTHEKIHFSVLICFEDLFPELSRRFVQRGADFLINITNDAWYKRTSASHQHLQASVFRAVENRISVARAANTGVSGFIAPSGKIISLVQDKAGKTIFIDGFKTQEILVSEKKPTFYARFGDTPVLALIIFMYLASWFFTHKRTNEPAN